MKKGFTLIELLVVVLIIGIIAAIALPQYNKSVRKSQLVELLQTIKNLEGAADRYLLANGAPSSVISYSDALDAFDVEFPNRSGAYVLVGNKYRVYTMLSNATSYGGFHIHVDVVSGTGSVFTYNKAAKTIQCKLNWGTAAKPNNDLGKEMCGYAQEMGYNITLR